MVLSFLIFWVSNIFLRCLFFLICRPWFSRTIVKWEWLHFDWFIEIFSVLKVKVKMFMDCFEIWYFIRYFGSKSAVSNTASRSSTFSCSLLWKLILSLNHFLYALREVKISISIYDFFKYLLSPLHFLLIDSIQQIDFAVPRHRPCNELIFFRRKVAMDFCWFWHH